MYQWHDPAPDLSWETRQNLKSTCQRPACFVPDWWNSKLVVKSPDNKKNEELVNGCLFPPNMVIVGMNKHQTMIPMLRVSTPHVAPCCFKLHVHAEKDEGFEPRDFGAPRVHNKPHWNHWNHQSLCSFLVNPMRNSTFVADCLHPNVCGFYDHV